MYVYDISNKRCLRSIYVLLTQSVTSDSLICKPVPGKGDMVSENNPLKEDDM